MGLLPHLFPLLLNQWDEKSVREEASRFKSRTDFAKGSGAAYNAARRLKIIDSLFESKLEKWSVEKIELLSQKCSTKKDLKRLNASAYNAALRFNIIGRLFDNQGRVRERDCVYLWSVNGEPGLYKFGITSSSMGDYRIKQVAKEANVESTLLLLEQVGYEGAKKLESVMKRAGTPYKFSKKFYGCTEFRYMTPSQVAQCIKAVKEYRQMRGV